MNLAEHRGPDTRKDDPHPGLPPFEDHESPYRVPGRGKENIIFS
jgi:hypothetical protein